MFLFHELEQYPYLLHRLLSSCTLQARIASPVQAYIHGPEFNETIKLLTKVLSDLNFGNKCSVAPTFGLLSSASSSKSFSVSKVSDESTVLVSPFI